MLKPQKNVYPNSGNLDTLYRNPLAKWHEVIFEISDFFFTPLMHSCTQDFLQTYIKQGKTNAERADLGQFIKAWEIASRWTELFGAGW